MGSSGEGSGSIIEWGSEKPSTAILRFDCRTRRGASIHGQVARWIGHDRIRCWCAIGANVRAIGAGIFVGAVHGQSVVAARVVGEAHGGGVAREEVPGWIVAYRPIDEDVLGECPVGEIGIERPGTLSGAGTEKSQ